MDTKINDIFDSRSALTGLYLWLLFGYLSSMISCDLQKLMTENNAFRHIIGIVAFFFLFTLIDSHNKSHIHIGYIWLKTFIVYFLFILMTKSKWYFSLPVLLIIIIDQSIKFHIEYLNNINSLDKSINEFEDIRNILYKLLIVLIIIGFTHYGIRQYNDFGNDFSITKLLFISKCNLNNKI